MNKEIDIGTQNDVSSQGIIQKGLSLPVWVETVLFWLDGASKEEYNEILHEMRSLEADTRKNAEDGENNDI